MDPIISGSKLFKQMFLFRNQAKESSFFSPASGHGVMESPKTNNRKTF